MSPGWIVGGGSALAVSAAVSRAMRHSGARHPSPADAVTLSRAIMSSVVAGLVVDVPRRPLRRAVAVPLTVGALVLDAVDGAVARHTGSSSAFGARLDGEVDAFLILTLTTHVSRSFGRWVLVGGVARYIFGAAGWVWPWMRRPLPPRYWRKVAAATEGITLTAAMSGVLPRRITLVGLAAGAALIAESFGRDIWWLWTRHGDPL